MFSTSTHHPMATNTSKKLNIKIPSGKLATCKLFVGNLATHTTGVHLQSIFHSYGQVIECVKVRERYGFVRFSTIDEAQRALNACHGIPLNGYPMIVEYAQNEILISPKSPRSSSKPPSVPVRYPPGKLPTTPIAIHRHSTHRPDLSQFARHLGDAKRHLLSTLNPDASSFTYPCSTSDYYSQSDKISSSSSSVRSNCVSPSILSTALPMSCSDEEEADDVHDHTHRTCTKDHRQSLNLFIGDQILSLFGSNVDTSIRFDGKLPRVNVRRR